MCQGVARLWKKKITKKCAGGKLRRKAEGVDQGLWFRVEFAWVVVLHQA
jgi:hypothetical protein